jgi:glutamate dehydrogenase (NAD(P)+)
MDITLREIGDDLGPAKTLCLRQLKPGLEAFVVIDNVACGPAIGGIRMASDVTLGEGLRLARAMTLKNAAAGLPHGGAKAGIVADPSIPKQEKEGIIRAFAHAIRDLCDYIPGPDMGVE